MENENNDAKRIDCAKATKGGKAYIENDFINDRPIDGYDLGSVNFDKRCKPLLGSDKPGPIKREQALELRGYKMISIEDKILTLWKETSDISNYIIECQINFRENTIKFSEDYPSGSRPHAASLGDMEVMLDILIAQEFTVKFHD